MSEATTPIRLMLVDDHAVVRAGLRMLLEAEPDMLIVAEAADGKEAIALAQETRPDVIVMDISLPDMNGIEATRQIRARCPETAVLALTVHEDSQYFFQMLGAGASGYVPKRAAADDLVAAIRVVHRGEVFLYPSVAKVLVRSYLGQAGPTAAVPDEERLTPREEEVLIRIAEGLTNQEIAEQLVLSVKTVDRHRENIMRKLKLHRRAELVKYAIERGLIEL
jgi:two-component system response regulator NreC